MSNEGCSLARVYKVLSYIGSDKLARKFPYLSVQIRFSKIRSIASALRHNIILSGPVAVLQRL